MAVRTRGRWAVPGLLNIHGGPASQYGFNFFDEFQVYVGAGYAVLACNPRGSVGRGEAWLTAVKGDAWGEVDVFDVTAVVDDALATDSRLDGERLGIMGGSYGGFLSAWIIADNLRRRSAIVERTLLGWESFAGTSDIARDFSITTSVASPWMITRVCARRVRSVGPAPSSHQR